MSEDTLRTVDYFSPLTWISWVLAHFVRGAMWVVVKLRKPYDPEARQCPCCGFKGDAGTANKTCSIECIETTGPERAALKYTCFRCGGKFFSKTVVPAEQWMAQKPPEPAKNQLLSR